MKTGEGDRALARWKELLTQRFIVVAGESSTPTPLPPFSAIAGQDEVSWRERFEIDLATDVTLSS
jgi:hypothetical protein